MQLWVGTDQKSIWYFTNNFFWYNNQLTMYRHKGYSQPCILSTHICLHLCLKTLNNYLFLSISILRNTDSLWLYNTQHDSRTINPCILSINMVNTLLTLLTQSIFMSFISFELEICLMYNLTSPKYNCLGSMKKSKHIFNN